MAHIFSSVTATAASDALFPSDAASVTPDAQGRIVIPQSLLDKVGITKNATVAGRGAYLEIWAEEVYAEKQSKRDLTSMLEQLSAYGL